METRRFYRGGPSLKAGTKDVRIDRVTNRLKPSRGISVYDRPDHANLTAFGGAYLLGALPDGLRVLQVGHDPSHHEVVPDTSRSLTFEEFQRLLDQIVLTPVESHGEGV